MPLFNKLVMQSALFTVLFAALVTTTVADTQGPQISVSGNGEIKAKPDQATINFNLRTKAPDSLSAKKESDRRVNNFFDAIEDLGIKEDQIQAGSINISAEYDYQNRQQRFIGFQSSRNISIDISDLDMLHPVLDTAIEQKIDGIQGISYSSSKEDEMREQARLAAIKDSKQKAKQLAEAYDAKLGPIYNINYYSGNVSQAYKAQPEMRMAMAADSSGGRFMPGEITVTDSISVIFDLITE